ncbi:MAG TPA: GerW family sporulation protein [Peptococcaceae bacterium]|jgi:sporulation protein YtfJ|nr:sporulation protein YtfJ [Clostridia bacterium]HOB82750.1 GerW family sporulation protein [Peptococcaceae bacterium]HPZ71430.1 GerW family sporulation protein [Peptococcaceae bacterium]HQD54523.1 GerW family sporulation protein [Peptococcaceae bacterium]
MSDHPIEGLMKTAMESIKEMTDVNTVVGDAVETPDGTVIIPVSQVACGFAAGGSEFSVRGGRERGEQDGGTTLPFGGGSGAGVSVQPVGFLVVGNGQVRLISVNEKGVFLDRLIEAGTQVIEQMQHLMKKKKAIMAGPNSQCVGAEFVGAAVEEE